VGETYFILDENIFKFCNSNAEWSQIDLRGERGDQGAAGIPGEKGEKGTPATPGSNWALYSGNTRIGKIYTNPLDAGMTWIPQNDPTFVEIEPRTFFFGYIDQISQGKFATKMFSCQYTSSDCSGTCYLNHEPLVESEIPKPILLYVFTNDLDQPIKVDYSMATTIVTNSYRNDLSSSCVVSTSTNSVVPAVDYTMPGGFQYPIENVNYRTE